MGFDQKNCPALKDLLQVGGLVDIFRANFPRKNEYTFYRASCAPSRLDRFYSSVSILDKVQSVCHIASLSDHCGIKLRLQVNITRTVLPKQERRTYWKLNCAILNDEDFLPSFKLLWEKIVKFRQNYQDIADWWDMLAKPEIKDFCIGFSIQRRVRREDVTLLPKFGIREA